VALEPPLLPPHAARTRTNNNSNLRIASTSLITLKLRLGSPAILGSFVALERRGGSEDPWLCVSDFRQICLYRNAYPPTTEDFVNSGFFLLTGLGHKPSYYLRFFERLLCDVKRPLS
jgi:hypothetical protein